MTRTRYALSLLLLAAPLGAALEDELLVGVLGAEPLEIRAALESLTAIRRAGADVIVSYWAKEVARWL